MRTHRQTLFTLTCAALLLCSCSPSQSRPAKPSSPKERSPMPTTQSFTLTSPAFPNGGQIPRRYTCDDDDISPDLAWSGAPANSQSFALIADDPDAPAGVWTHWLIWNIPPKATVLPADTPKNPLLDNGARQGLNDFRRVGYGGPCPPPGKPHRYFFKLYALDTRLDLKAGANKAALEDALKPHILAHTQIMGTYKR